MSIIPANIISDAFSGQNALTTELAGYGLLPPQWGIFNASGTAVVTADQVKTFDYRKDWAISDYPQERGAFQSYNKVAEPGEVKVEFLSGGSLSNRIALLNSIDAIAGDLNLYDVVTPEKTYISYNVSHVEYRRADGVSGLLKVGVHLTQIRIATATTLSNTAQPSGNATVNNGQVQATDTSLSTGTQSEVFAQVNAANSNNAAAAANRAIAAGA